MTVVAAVKHEHGILMGGDTASCGTGTYNLYARGKVVRINDRLLIGSCGLARLNTLLHYKFKAPPHARRLSDDAYVAGPLTDKLFALVKSEKHLSGTENDAMEGHLLVAYKHELYLLDGGFAVLQPTEPFAAIGSGEAHALASLHTTADLPMPPHERLTRALRAAARYTSTVYEPFTYEEIRTVTAR
jgi:ATP-dependent protease HslVU (ClpYQ) peptidase subunit